MNWARTIWYVLTLRCEEADRLRSVSGRGGLSRSQRFGERLHRSLCASCREAARQIERIDRGLGHLGEGIADGAGWSEQRRARLETGLRSGLQSGPGPDSTKS